MSLRQLIGLGLAVGVSGCSSGTEPGLTAPAPPNGLFTTNAVDYVAKADPILGNQRYAFSVITRYTNPTKAPIYLATCFPRDRNPIYGVELRGQTDQWGSAFSMAWGCVGHDQQIRVDAGATRIDTLQLQGPNGFDGTTNQVLGVLGGRVRLVFSPQSCPGDGVCGIRIANESLRYSNEFTIRLP